MSHKIVYEKWTFPADKIREGNLYLATSLLSSSLEVNTLSVPVECEDPSILDFQRNAQLLYYAQPAKPMVFRVQSILRVAPTLYELSCTSTLGLLAEGLHMGGIYTGQTALDVIADICGPVPFIVKTNLADTKLYGWLPIASPRDNLSQVLFAIGAALKTDLDGVLRIAGLWDGVSSSTPQDRMYTDAKVDYGAKVTQVVLAEHQYFEGHEEKKLFEGTAQEGEVITFNAPMHSLSATGITIQASGANWARVSAGSGTLTGKEYIHNTRLISRDVQTANVPNVKTVDKATLISLVNSAATADRLVSYFKCQETINAPVVYHGEHTGNVMSICHPFDKTAVNACLQSADITLSNTLKAQEKILVGYIPLSEENGETISVLLVGNGTFVVPEGVSELDAVVIGAGGAGTPGKRGESKATTETEENSGSVSFHRGASASVDDIYSATGVGRPGVGGEGGLAGNPGKVLEVKMSVTGGDTIEYSCGLGGVDPGADGSETTFGEHSSSEGTIYNNGYFDIMSNTLYAVRGSDGLRGGNGGEHDSKGEDVSGSVGGNPIVPTAVSDEGYNSSFYGSTSISALGYTGKCGGGGAGGASGEANGTNGGDATQMTSPISIIANPGRTSYVDVYGGYPGIGGDGADGEDGRTYGSSGSGGGGGGGSGAYGSVEAKASANFFVDYGSHDELHTAELHVTVVRGSSDTQGNGGAKGNGADGCVIVRYRIKKKIQSVQFVDKNGKHFLEKFTRRFIV